MTPLRTFAATARRQHRVITYAQLLDLDLTKEQIHHLRRTERIVRVHRGTYALNEPLTPAGVAMAAVLRCQPRAAADRLTAAALLGLRESWPARPQVVTARRTSGKSPKGIALHHSGTLRASDIVRGQGVLCTSIDRTIVDCSRLLDDRGTKQLLRQAERLHRFDISQLDRPGIPKNLREVLTPYVATSGFTANEMEAALVEICAHASLPLPDTQEVRGPYRVDFIWEALKIVVETDGRGSHAITTAFVDDRARDRHLAAQGYVVLRFTWAEIEHTPSMVARDLAAVVALRTCSA